MKNNKGDAIIPKVLKVGRNMEILKITGEEYLFLNIVDL
jgi:hypothetical protein